MSHDHAVNTEPDPVAWTAPSRAGGSSSAWRGRLAGVLVLLGCVAAGLAVPVGWARATVSTQAYRETAVTVAADPDVRRAVAEKATDTVTRSVDIQGQVRTSLSALAALGLPAPIVQRLRGVLEPAGPAVQALVEKEIAASLASPTAVRIWTATLTDVRDAAVDGRTGTVVVDLGPLIQDVRHRLAALGLRPAASAPAIPPGSTTVTVLRPAGARTAHEWYARIDALAVPLAVTAIALLGGALAVARRRRRRVVLALAGAGVACAMGLVVLATGWLRGPVLSRLVGVGVPDAVGASAYDAYAGSLRGWAFWTLGIALAVAILAALTTTLGSRQRG